MISLFCFIQVVLLMCIRKSTSSTGPSRAEVPSGAVAVGDWGIR